MALYFLMGMFAALNARSCSGFTSLSPTSSPITAAVCTTVLPRNGTRFAAASSVSKTPMLRSAAEKAPATKL